MFLNEESQRIAKNTLAEGLRKDVMQKSDQYCSIGLSLLGSLYWAVSTRMRATG